MHTEGGIYMRTEQIQDQSQGRGEAEKLEERPSDPKRQGPQGGRLYYSGRKEVYRVKNNCHAASPIPESPESTGDKVPNEGEYESYACDEEPIAQLVDFRIRVPKRNEYPNHNWHSPWGYKEEYSKEKNPRGTSPIHYGQNRDYQGTLTGRLKIRRLFRRGRA